MKRKRAKTQKADVTAIVQHVSSLSPSLVADVRELIASARQRVAAAVNSELAFLYWQIGKRVREDILGMERAEYGRQILSTLCAKLTAEFGPGYTPGNMFLMIRFAEAFPDLEIVRTLCVKLSWSHIRRIIYVEDQLGREFYAEMAQLERWSVRALEDRSRSMLFERTAVSKKPEDLIQKKITSLRQNGQLTPDLVFRDPYFLDFLGLHSEHSELPPRALLERKLHDAILIANQRLERNSTDYKPLTTNH